MTLLMILYLLVSFSVTKLTKEIVDPPLDWSSEKGLFCALGIFLSFYVLFIPVKLMTDFKLKRNGHEGIVYSQQDRLFLRKNTDLGELQKQKNAHGIYNHYKPSRLQSITIPSGLNRNYSTQDDSMARAKSYSGVESGGNDSKIYVS